MDAKAAQRPLQSCLQTWSAPEKEMKELELSDKPPFVPCRCMVRGRTAKAGGQSPKPAQKQKVKVGGRRADRRPAGELMSSRVGRGVARRDSTPREHRQQVHRSAGPLRAPGALLHRRRLQTIPTSPAGGEQKSGARRPICMGQNKLSGIRSGRLLHRTGLQGQRSKGSAAAPARRRPVRRRHRGKRSAGLSL